MDGTHELKRIQRKRSKNWRMPPNTVYVGRPSRWGNPYRIDDRTRNGAVIEYRAWAERQFKDNPAFLYLLRGKNLACWCPKDKWCHADVLLKMVRELEQRLTVTE